MNSMNCIQFRPAEIDNHFLTARVKEVKDNAS